METTLHFLDAVKARHGLKSDYSLAPLLGITRSAVSKFRSGKDFFGDSTAIRVAELLEIDPAIVLASVHAERAKSEAEKTAWRSIIEKLGGIAAALLISLSGLSAPTPAQASTFDNNSASNMDYAKRRRRPNKVKQHKAIKISGLDPLTLFHLGIHAQ